MLLLHQSGSVKVAEVVRYTLTYIPSHDRVLPTPPFLHVKIRNTSAIALRAAYLHGPYTLYAACYPASFDANVRDSRADELGDPQFEPNIRAGGQWSARLKVPEHIREVQGKANLRRNLDGSTPTVKWVIEISSQVLFSTTAAVHYEITVARDEKSVNLGFAGLVGGHASTPGQLSDHQLGRRRKGKAAQPHGLYSQALDLLVEDTATLWNKPPLLRPEEEEEEGKRKSKSRGPKQDAGLETLTAGDNGSRRRMRRKIHLVILTHGLHSNLGADMLYLKEEIDKSAARGRESYRKRRAKMHKRNDERRKKNEEAQAEGKQQPFQGISGDDQYDSGDEFEEEEVVVRGFGGNSCKTEKGIQYLGKRLSKYVLSMTYPDQPYLYVKKPKSLSRAFTGHESEDISQPHSKSTIRREEPHTDRQRPFQVTAISFIGHSLGGLTNLYAMAYIYKHSPEFFDKIRPVNFVALASPLLGLSNENPLYVKFALDFGLVGRTGQDLGLTWKPPTAVRSGWEAMIAGIGSEQQKKLKDEETSSKPLLRVLPTGPAHHVLKMFKNRTIYSNVVNDGIVPLRTSCLLFLDYRSLGQIEKARRQNGFVGTMAGWGWAEVTGTNSSLGRNSPLSGWFDNGGGRDDDDDTSGTNTPTRRVDGDAVPQPDDNATNEDDQVSMDSDPKEPRPNQFLSPKKQRFTEGVQERQRPSSPLSPIVGFLSMLKPASHGGDKTPQQDRTKHKDHRAYQRGQTMSVDTSKDSGERGNGLPSGNSILSPVVPASEESANVASEHGDLLLPPKTTVFEAAGDLLNPPLPPIEYIANPAARPRTIFHDRVYHPDDIPPPPPRTARTLFRSLSGEGKDLKSPTSSFSSKTNVSGAESDSQLSGSILRHRDTDLSGSSGSSSSGMKVEEKIARAYHRDLSWRKVLVRLEPDAHNNMVVRRMFANAYGWPVVKHLVDTHFGDTYAAHTADELEPNIDRVANVDEAPSSDGREVDGQEEVQPPPEADSRLEQVSSAQADGTDESRDEGEGSNRTPRARPAPLPNNIPSINHVGSTPDTPTQPDSAKRFPHPLFRADSATWDDRFFASDASDSDSDDPEQHADAHRRPALSRSGSEVSDKTDEEVRRWADQAKDGGFSTEMLGRPVVVPFLSRVRDEGAAGGTSEVGLRRSVEERLRPIVEGGAGSPKGSRRGSALVGGEKDKAKEEDEEKKKGSLASGTASIK